MRSNRQGWHRCQLLGLVWSETKELLAPLRDLLASCGARAAAWGRGRTQLGPEAAAIDAGTEIIVYTKLAALAIGGKFI
jgi:hypothetical protein